MTRIVLCMIVKNESKIIRRCLDATKPFIDYVCISDTGSDDGTPKIIRSWGKKNNVPTTVYRVKRHFGDILSDAITIIKSFQTNGSVSKLHSTFGKLYNEFKEWPQDENRDHAKLLNIFKNPEECTNYLDYLQKLHDSQWTDKPLRHPQDTTFLNFGHNRTLSFKLAKETYLEADYALFVDADMILRVGDFDKNSLTHSGYKLYQINGNLKYTNLRMASTKLDWECVGVTHEYWSAPGNRGKIDADDMYIADVGDGGCKSDKFERDIRLLKGELEEDNSSYDEIYVGYRGVKTKKKPLSDGLRSRYKFYLAQSYKDSGHPDKSIPWYKSRIEEGGWPEEVWYSYYRVGLCYLDIENRYHREAFKLEKEKDIIGYKLAKENAEINEGLALTWMLKAHNFRPTRVEALMVMAKFYRTRGKNAPAYLFAKLGCDKQFFDRGMNDELFIEHKYYTHMPEFEVGVTAFYLGRMEEGKEACEKLLAMDNIPEGDRKRTEENLRFYIQALKDK